MRSRTTKRRLACAAAAAAGTLLASCVGYAQSRPPTPKSFDEAHNLFTRHRSTLEDALKSAFRARCVDQKGADAIYNAELAIRALKDWMALLQQWPFFAPIPPVTEPVASPGELKGRVAWAQFMVGRLAFHVGHLRSQKPCEGVSLKPPADFTKATPDGNPGCTYTSEAEKISDELGQIQTKLGELSDAREEQVLAVEKANAVFSKVRYFRDNPSEKPADFNAQTEEADAKASKQRAEEEIKRIDAELDVRQKAYEELVAKLKQALPCREPAAVIDRCLVGKWTSESMTIAGEKSAGGEGIVITIATDGKIVIDYTGMKPIRASPFGPTSNQWQGTAAGTIETNSGAIRIKGVEKSDLTWRFTDGKGKVTSRTLAGLGPAAPGGNPNDSSYTCTETTLTYKNPAEGFTFKRVP